MAKISDTDRVIERLQAEISDRQRTIELLRAAQSARPKRQRKAKASVIVGSTVDELRGTARK